MPGNIEVPLIGIFDNMDITSNAKNAVEKALTDPIRRAFSAATKGAFDDVDFGSIQRKLEDALTTPIKKIGDTILSVISTATKAAIKAAEASKSKGGEEVISSAFGSLGSIASLASGGAAAGGEAAAGGAAASGAGGLAASLSAVLAPEVVIPAILVIAAAALMLIPIAVAIKIITDTLDAIFGAFEQAIDLWGIIFKILKFGFEPIINLLLPLLIPFLYAMTPFAKAMNMLMRPYMIAMMNKVKEDKAKGLAPQLIFADIMPILIQGVAASFSALLLGMLNADLLATAIANAIAASTPSSDGTTESGSETPGVMPVLLSADDIEAAFAKELASKLSITWPTLTDMTLAAAIAAVLVTSPLTIPAITTDLILSHLFGDKKYTINWDVGIDNSVILNYLFGKPVLSTNINLLDIAIATIIASLLIMDPPLLIVVAVLWLFWDAIIAAINGLGTVTGGLISFMATTWNTFIFALTGPGQLTDSLGSLASSITTFLSGIWNTFTSAVEGIANALKDLSVDDIISSAANILKVKDAVITPSGQVIQTDPEDYLFATKDPSSLGGGNKGGSINVSINVYGNGDREIGELVKRNVENVFSQYSRNGQFQRGY